MSTCVSRSVPQFGTREESVQIASEHLRVTEIRKVLKLEVVWSVEKCEIRRQFGGSMFVYHGKERNQDLSHRIRRRSSSYLRE